MRRMLTLGILAVATLGQAGLLTCDSAGVARAEEARPVPYIHPDWFVRELEPLSEENRRRYALPEFTSQSRHEFYLRLQHEQRQRPGPPVGDFWSQDEIDRIFGRPAFGW